MERIDELKKLISAADEEYWRTGKGPVDDTTYDRWVEELRMLDPKTDQVFGTPHILSNGKIKHPIPMLSMNKCYDLNQVVSWAKKYAKNQSLLVMPKYDGIALVKYHDGMVGTRGDGKVGENVTHVTRPFMQFEAPGLGEAIIKNSEFEKLRDLGYQHPRNAVSGILGSLDPLLQIRASFITFARYNNKDFIIELSDKDFNVDKFDKTINQVKILARDYPMDGIVFKIKDNKTFFKLGHTAHHWRGQIAYKFKKPGVPSIIREVFYQEKNGTITPMVRFDPVFCDGAYLSKASCSNWDKVKEWDIRVGDKCEVERAGGVIPYLLKTEHTKDSQETIEPPTLCPTCNTKLIKEGKRLYCPQCDK